MKIQASFFAFLLAVIVILFHIYSATYLGPLFSDILSSSDPIGRILALSQNIPFLLALLSSLIAMLVLPVLFMRQNKVLFQRKWISFCFIFAVYFLNLFILVAAVVVPVYLWNSIRKISSSNPS